MNIICDQDRMPPKPLMDKMAESAKVCAEMEGLDPDRIEISLTFVSSPEIRELNKLYRNVDKVTDVLSFPQYEDLNDIDIQGEIMLGDVVICGEQAVLQADEYGHSNERELTYLFVHSIWHLLGYDHMEEEEKEEMRQKEEQVMSRIHMER